MPDETTSPAGGEGPSGGSRDPWPVVSGMSEIVAAGAPLEAGLRALAEDDCGDAMRKTLLALADALSRGESLETAAAQLGPRAPRYLAPFLAQGVKTSTLAENLERLVAHHRTTAELRRQARSSLAYPALLYAALCVVTMTLLLTTIPALVKIYEDFGVAIPPPSRLLVLMCEHVWLTGLVLATPPALVWACRGLPGPALLHRLRLYIPVLGPLWRMAAHAEFCRTLCLFVERGGPLPDGLRAASYTADDAEIVAGAEELARRVESGARLSDSLADLDQFPPTMSPVLSWGERNGTLQEALTMLAELYEETSRNYARLLRSLAPTLSMLAIAIVAAFLATATFTPLISFIDRLAY